MDTRLFELISKLTYSLKDSRVPHKRGFSKEYSSDLFEREHATRRNLLGGINQAIVRNLTLDPTLTLESSLPLIDATVSACMGITEEGSIEEEAIVKEVANLSSVVGDILERPVPQSAGPMLQ